MLADIGNNVLMNTNEIRNIRIQFVETRASRQWVIMVYTTDDDYDILSAHETEQEAIEHFARVRQILREAKCLVDLAAFMR